MARKRKSRRNWGTGSVVAPRAVGGTWGVQFRENGQRRFKGGFADKGEAEVALSIIAGKHAVGDPGLPPSVKDQPTLAVEAEPFLKIRDTTHVAGYEDRLRWTNHLAPYFGHLKPSQVTVSLIRGYIEGKRVEGVNPATIRIMISLMRQLFQRLVDDAKAQANPFMGLSREIQAMYKPTHDPKTTPFIEKLADVQRIYADLPQPLNMAYAIGALAGLRTSEIFGLLWEHIDLDARRIHVCQQAGSKKGEKFKVLKDKDSRVVPILDALVPILKMWKLKTGGEGLVIRPLRKDGAHINKKTPGPVLTATLEKLELSKQGLGWYEATRHTFGSHWVKNGGSIEQLSAILGHYSITITERTYVHLKPELFSPKDLAVLPIRLDQPTGQVLPLVPTTVPVPSQQSEPAGPASDRSLPRG